MRANWANTYPLVRDLASLEALPDGVVIHDGDGDAAEVATDWRGERWAAYCGNLNPDKLDAVPLPVVVLFAPEPST